MLLTMVQILTIVCCFFMVATVDAAERLKRVKSEPAPAPAPVANQVTILSIIPAQAEPGTKVVLSGTGFGENATVFLCST